MTSSALSKPWSPSKAWGMSAVLLVIGAVLTAAASWWMAWLGRDDVIAQQWYTQQLHQRLELTSAARKQAGFVDDAFATLSRAWLERALGSPTRSPYQIAIAPSLDLSRLRPWLVDKPNAQARLNASLATIEFIDDIEEWLMHWDKSMTPNDSFHRQYAFGVWADVMRLRHEFTADIEAVCLDVERVPALRK